MKHHVNILCTWKPDNRLVKETKANYIQKYNKIKPQT
jgi:hypothetical protein